MKTVGRLCRGCHVENMDCVWTHLPLALSEKICNLLPQVRGIPEALKEEIQTSQQKRRYKYLLNNYPNNLTRDEMSGYWDETDELYMTLVNKGYTIMRVAGQIVIF